MHASNVQCTCTLTHTATDFFQHKMSWWISCLFVCFDYYSFSRYFLLNLVCHCRLLKRTKAKCHAVKWKQPRVSPNHIIMAFDRWCTLEMTSPLANNLNSTQRESEDETINVDRDREREKKKNRWQCESLHIHLTGTENDETKQQVENKVNWCSQRIYRIRLFVIKKKQFLFICKTTKQERKTIRWKTHWMKEATFVCIYFMWIFRIFCRFGDGVDFIASHAPSQHKSEEHFEHVECVAYTNMFVFNVFRFFFNVCFRIGTNLIGK